MEYLDLFQNQLPEDSAQAKSNTYSSTSKAYCIKVMEAYRKLKSKNWGNFTSLNSFKFMLQI